MQIPGQGIQNQGGNNPIRPPKSQNAQQLPVGPAGPNAVGPQVLPQTSGPGAPMNQTKGNPTFDIGMANNASKQAQANTIREANNNGVKWKGRSHRGDNGPVLPATATNPAPAPMSQVPVAGNRQAQPQNVPQSPKANQVPVEAGFFATDMSGYYQPNYTQYELARTQFIAGLLSGVSDKARILDLGSGIGRYLGQSLLRGMPNRQVFAVEGRPMLEMELRRTLADQNLPLTPVRGDLNKSDVLPSLGKFDVAQAFSILEHLRNPEQVISQIAPMLNAKGFFIVEAKVSGNEAQENEKCVEQGNGKNFFGALDGQGTSFSRSGLANMLMSHFKYVYAVSGVPAHVSYMPSPAGYRVILVASMEPLAMSQLLPFQG